MGLMTSFSFTVLVILMVHINNLSTIQYSKIKVPAKNFSMIFLLYIGAIFAEAIGFGRRYRPVAIFFFSLLCMIFIVCHVIRLAEWMEKLFVILSELSLAGEYFHIGIRYWTESNYKKKIFYSFYVQFRDSIFILLLFLILLVVFCSLFHPWMFIKLQFTRSTIKLSLEIEHSVVLMEKMDSKKNLLSIYHLKHD